MDRRQFLTLFSFPLFSSIPQYADAGIKGKSEKLTPIPTTIKLLYLVGRILCAIYTNRKDIADLVEEFRNSYEEEGAEGLLDLVKMPRNIIFSGLLKEEKANRNRKLRGNSKQWKKFLNRLGYLPFRLDQEDWKALLLFLNQEIVLKDGSCRLVTDSLGHPVLVGDHPIVEKALDILSNENSTGRSLCL